MVAATNSLHEVEKLYKAYYGRAADQDGAAYWAAKVDAAGGDVSKIAGEFAYSQEATDLYGGLDDHAKVDKIYEQVFGRHADAAGLNFYVAKLQSGEMTHDTVMLNVLDGAQGDDLAKLEGDVDDAVGKLDSAQIDALVAHYRSTLHTDDSADHSSGGADDSGLVHTETHLEDAGHSPDLHVETHIETHIENHVENHVEGMDDILGLVGMTGATAYFDM